MPTIASLAKRCIKCDDRGEKFSESVFVAVGSTKSVTAAAIGINVIAELP